MRFSFLHHPDRFQKPHHGGTTSCQNPSRAIGCVVGKVAALQFEADVQFDLVRNIAPVQGATPTRNKSGRSSVLVVSMGVKPEFQESVLVDSVVIIASPSDALCTIKGDQFVLPWVACLRLLQGVWCCGVQFTVPTLSVIHR